LKRDFTVKKIDVNKQTRIRDINNAPPSTNLLSKVVPINPIIMAIILKILSFIDFYVLS
jgi:hypothetical protein